MWDYVGIVRSDRRLQRAQDRIELLQNEITDYYRRFRISRPLLELRNLGQVAQLMVNCALTRKESRGLHFNQDHPQRADNPSDSILTPANYRGVPQDQNRQALPDYEL